MRANESVLKRPFIFEFTGTPSAGKTTTITELDKLFRRMGFRVLCPQEGAQVIRHIDRTTPLYNISTGIEAAKKLVSYATGHLYDVVLFDRCIFDAYCWMHYWEKKGLLAPRERQSYQDFFLSRFLTTFIDGAYFMICDAERAVQRELRIALSSELGATTNPESIRLLAEIYHGTYRKLRAKYPQLRIFNATHYNERSMVEEISRQVLATMERKAAHQ